MEPNELTCRFLAGRLGVSPSTLNRILTCKSGLSPEMALRLSKVLGRTPESWLIMQDNYNLWLAKKRVNLDNTHPLEFCPG